MTLNNPANWIR